MHTAPSLTPVPQNLHVILGAGVLNLCCCVGWLRIVDPCRVQMFAHLLQWWAVVLRRFLVCGGFRLGVELTVLSSLEEEFLTRLWSWPTVVRQPWHVTSPSPVLPCIRWLHLQSCAACSSVPALVRPRSCQKTNISSLSVLTSELSAVESVFTLLASTSATRPLNSAVMGYTTEGALLISSLHLSTDVAPKSHAVRERPSWSVQNVWVLRLWDQHSIEGLS